MLAVFGMFRDCAVPIIETGEVDIAETSLLLGRPLSDIFYFPSVPYISFVQKNPIHCQVDQLDVYRSTHGSYDDLV